MYFFHFSRSFSHFGANFTANVSLPAQGPVQGYAGAVFHPLVSSRVHGQDVAGGCRGCMHRAPEAGSRGESTGRGPGLTTLGVSVADCETHSAGCAF